MSNIVEIIDFEPSLKPYFRDLNIEWIEHYFAVEPHDLEQLEQPEKFILNDGGKIYFARYNQQIVGTIGLVKVDDQNYELVKMAVSPKHQGLGIGKALATHLIAEAKALGCKRLFLESNPILTAALTLYEKLGFVEVPLVPSLYNRVGYRAEMYL